MNGYPLTENDFDDFIGIIILPTFNNDLMPFIRAKMDLANVFEIYSIIAD